MSETTALSVLWSSEEKGIRGIKSYFQLITGIGIKHEEPYKKQLVQI